MDNEFLTWAVLAVVGYGGVAFLVSLFYLFSKQRRRAEDAYASEAARWLDQASLLNARRWDGPAVLTAYSALERVVRGMAEERRFAATNVPLTSLVSKLADEGVLDKDDVKKIQSVSAIRNQLAHGPIDSVAEEELKLAYDECVAITESLLSR